MVLGGSLYLRAYARSVNGRLYECLHGPAALADDPDLEKSIVSDDFDVCNVRHCPQPFSLLAPPLSAA